MPLNTDKLVNLKRAGSGKRTAQCPVCAAAGRDLKGRDHLIVYDDGRYGCVVDQSDEHSKAIWRAIGGSVEGADDSQSQLAEPQVEIERTWDASVLDRLVQDDRYWHLRGISSETLAPFRGGVAPNGQMAHRYVFPIFDYDGQIIGFDGRHTWKERPTSPDGKVVPPWKIVGNKNRFVWGGLDEIVERDRAILVESIGDALMLREHGVPETLCLFGTFMSEAVLAYLITANPASIVISTNRDVKAHKAGQRAAEKVKDVIDRFFNPDRVTIVFPPERAEGESAKDWGESTAEEIAATFLTPPPESAAPYGGESDEDESETPDRA